MYKLFLWQKFLSRQKIFSFIVYLFALMSCFSSYAIEITLQISIKGPPQHSNRIINWHLGYALKYQTTDLLDSLMGHHNDLLVSLLGKKPSVKSFLKLIKQAEKGDKKLREALAFLFFDKWYINNISQNSSDKGHFETIPWNETIKQKIYSLFWKQSTPEALFIGSLRNYYKIKHSNDLIEIKQLSAEFFKFLRESRGFGFKSFDLFWAFTLLDLLYSDHPNQYLMTQFLGKESRAKKIVNNLARENYTPALFLHAILKLKSNNFYERQKKGDQKPLQEFADSLEKLYALEKDSENRSYMAGLLAVLNHYYLNNAIKAQQYFEKIIYESDDRNMKPFMLDNYLLTGDYPSALEVAKKMLFDYTNVYPIDYQINLFRFIIATLYKGTAQVQKNHFEALVFLETSRIFSIAYQKDIDQSIREYEKARNQIQKEIKQQEEKLDILEEQLSALNLKVREHDPTASNKELRILTESQKITMENRDSYLREIKYLQSIDAEQQKEIQIYQKFRSFIEQYTNSIDKYKNKYTKGLTQNEIQQVEQRTEDKIKESQRIFEIQTSSLSSCGQVFH